MGVESYGGIEEEIKRRRQDRLLRGLFGPTASPLADHIARCSPSTFRHRLQFKIPPPQQVCVHRVEAVCSRLFPLRHSHMFTSHIWLRTLPVPAPALAELALFSRLIFTPDETPVFSLWSSSPPPNSRRFGAKTLPSRPSVQKKTFHSSELQIHQQTQRLIVMIKKLLMLLEEGFREALRSEQHI